METMHSDSAQSVIDGHPRYACRVYYHHSEDYGEFIFDSSVIVDRRTDEEYDYSPRKFGVSEPVFAVAEDTAWEAVS